MASKHLALKRSASRKQPDVESSRDDEPEEGVSEKTIESSLEDSRPVNPEVSSLIKIIENLTTEKKPGPSRLQRFLTHPLFLVLVSGTVGVGLTHYYTLRQKDIEYNRSIQQLELTSQRSFSDELNKIRVQKIGEVWEQVDKNELALDDLLDKANKEPGSNEKDIAEISKIVDEDIAVINKNRFWLGEPTYDQLKEYLDITGRYVSDMLVGRRDIDLTETLKKREQLKQDILQIRRAFLTGEP